MGRRSGPGGLGANQVVSTYVYGAADRGTVSRQQVVAACGVIVDMRIAPVVDQHRLRGAPQRLGTQRRVLAARHVANAGAAFPPILMRGAVIALGLEPD